MALSVIGERTAQARALIRNEGLGKFAKRAGLAVKNRFVDRGNVIWIQRATTAATSADGADEMIVSECVSGSRAEQVAEQMRPITSRVRDERLAAGGVRYVIHADDLDDPIYTAWVYSERLPIAEHLGVHIPMPEAMAAVEDSFIAPAHRGVHAAAAVIDALGVLLHRQGVRTMIGKIDEENEAALGAARISGWQPFGEVYGTVWLNRVPRWRVRLDEPVVPQLQELERRPRGFA